MGNAWCPHCGGIIGVDCFNVEECGWIAQQIEQQAYQQAMEQAYAEHCAEEMKHLEEVQNPSPLPSDSTNQKGTCK